MGFGSDFHCDGQGQDFHRQQQQQGQRDQQNQHQNHRSPQQQEQRRQLDELARQAVGAIHALFQAGPGSTAQADANAWLLGLEADERSLALAVVLLEQGGSVCTRSGNGAQDDGVARHSGEEQQVLFFATQLVLSGVRQRWNHFPWETRIELFEVAIKLVRQPSIQLANLTLSRLILVIASIAVRCVKERPSVFQEAVNLFFVPPYKNAFEFLKLTIEELEICWKDLDLTERAATASMVIELRSGVLNLVGKLARAASQCSTQVDPEILKKALICLQAWTACMILSEAPESDGIENHNGSGRENLGIGFAQLIEKREGESGQGGVALLDWICYEFKRVPADSSEFEAIRSILVDSITCGQSEESWTSSPSVLKDYADGLNTLARALLDLFALVQAHREQGTISTFHDVDDDVLDSDPVILQWRALCHCVSALCTHHMKGLFAFGNQDCTSLVKILLFGIEWPEDDAALEFCLEFWEGAGDVILSSSRFWHAQVSKYSESPPPLLTAEGGMELLDLLVNALVTCMAYSVKGRNSQARRRLFDTLVTLCSSWPDLNNANGDYLTSRPGDENVHHVLGILDQRLVQITNKDTVPYHDDNVLYTMIALVDLLGAVLEANLLFDSDSDSDDDDDDDDDDEDDDDEYIDNEYDEDSDDEYEDVDIGCHVQATGHDLGTKSDGLAWDPESKPSDVSYNCNQPSARRRTLSLAVSFNGSSVYFSDQMPSTWSKVALQVLLVSSNSTNSDLRQSVCGLVGSIVARVLSRIGFGASGQSKGQSTSQETRGHFLALLSKSIGFLLSCITTGDAQVGTVAAASLHKIILKLTTDRAAVEVLRTLPIPIAVAPLGSEETLCGYEGMVSFLERPDVVRHLDKMLRVSSLLLECLATLSLHISLAEHHEFGGDWPNRLSMHLERLLGPTSVSIQESFVQAKSGSLEVKSAREATTRNTIVLTHVLKGLKRQVLKKSRVPKAFIRTVPNAVGPLFNKLWPSLGAISGDLILHQNCAELLEETCELLRCLLNCITSHAIALVPEIVQSINQLYQATFHPLCIQVLSNLAEVTCRDVVPRPLLESVSVIARSLIKTHPSLQSPNKGVPVPVILHDALLEPEMIKYLYDFAREVFSHDQTEFFRYTTSQSEPSLLTLLVSCGMECLSKDLGDRASTLRVCMFLQSILDVSGASPEMTVIVCSFKPGLLESSIGILARPVDSHVVRPSVIVDMLVNVLTLCDPENQSLESVLRHILSHQRYAALPHHVKNAVCSLLNQACQAKRLNRSKLKASVCDARLLLRGIAVGRAAQI